MILLKYIFETCTSPTTILTLLALLALWLSYGGRHRRSLKACLLLSATLQVLFLSTPLGEILIGRLEQTYQPVLQPETLGPVTWIVVLSENGVDHPGTPITSNLSRETLYRLTEALRVYRRLPKARVVVSGGVLRGTSPSRNSWQISLVRWNSAQDVLVEGESRTPFRTPIPEAGSRRCVLPGHLCVSPTAGKGVSQRPA
jgi:uncharacterized SAM-binding protein YcdF (DUF218 family)